MAAVNGYSYNYGYGYDSYQNSMLNSNSWTESAEKKADQMKEDLGISTSGSSSSSKTSSTSKTSSSSSTVKTASSTSVFLMEYQTYLEELESSAKKLQTSQKDNVFSKYDAALAEASKTQVGDGTVANKKVEEAEDAVVDATKEFMDKLNGTISYLSKNSGHSSTVAFQLASLKRTIPSEKGLAKIGISIDTSGKLKMDEDKFREALQNDPELVKDVLGGQFGMAERAGNKATTILDMSVNEIMDTEVTSDNSGTSTSTSASSTSSTSSKSAMSDSFRQFAAFAKSGAYNLTNYYAVSMLNILV